MSLREEWRKRSLGLNCDGVNSIEASDRIAACEVAVRKLGNGGVVGGAGGGGGETVVTRGDIERELADIAGIGLRVKAESTPNRLKALDMLAKLGGHYVEKVEIKGEIELVERMNRGWDRVKMVSSRTVVRGDSGSVRGELAGGCGDSVRGELAGGCGDSVCGDSSDGIDAGRIDAGSADNNPDGMD